jgi:hypothetical protein
MPHSMHVFNKSAIEGLCDTIVLGGVSCCEASLVMECPLLLAYCICFPMFHSVALCVLVFDALVHVTGSMLPCLLRD